MYFEGDVMTGAETANDERFKRKNVNMVAYYCIPAGIFLGLAAGYIFNNVTAGSLGGLGVGFLLFIVVKLTYK